MDRCPAVLVYAEAQQDTIDLYVRDAFGAEFESGWITEELPSGVTHAFYEYFHIEDSQKLERMGIPHIVMWGRTHEARPTICVFDGTTSEQCDWAEETHSLIPGAEFTLEQIVDQRQVEEVKDQMRKVEALKNAVLKAMST